MKDDSLLMDFVQFLLGVFRRKSARLLQWLLSLLFFKTIEISKLTKFCTKCQMEYWVQGLQLSWKRKREARKRIILHTKLQKSQKLSSKNPNLKSQCNFFSKTRYRYLSWCLPPDLHLLSCTGSTDFSRSAFLTVFLYFTLAKKIIAKKIVIKRSHGGSWIHW